MLRFRHFEIFVTCWLAFSVIPPSAFGSVAGAATYVLQVSGSGKAVRICLRHDGDEEETLSLRNGGSNEGIQIRNVSCLDMRLENVDVGRWIVPQGCMEVCWDVVPTTDCTGDAAAGHTVRRGDFLILNELSALPRLTRQPPAHSTIDVSLMGKPTLPTWDEEGKLHLPQINEAPFAIVWNAAYVNAEQNNDLTLTYFADDKSHAQHLPDVAAHMRGVAWLRERLMPCKPVRLNTLWVSGNPHEGGVAEGMAMHDMLIVKAGSQSASPYGDALWLYVALHEACHAMMAPGGGPWLAESLASWYGLRAMQAALPGDTRADHLARKFRDGAKAYDLGLRAIEQAVLVGDQTNRGAFYTKGIVFWDTVNQLLAQEHHGSLDERIADVLETRGDHEDERLRTALGLSSIAWEMLRVGFLE